MWGTLYNVYMYNGVASVKETFVTSLCHNSHIDIAKYMYVDWADIWLWIQCIFMDIYVLTRHWICSRREYGVIIKMAVIIYVLH